MQPNQDDFLSRPYEEWAQAADPSQAHETRQKLSSAKERNITVAILLAVLLGLSILPVQSILYAETVFAPSPGLALFPLVGTAVLSVLATSLAVYAKITKAVGLRWQHVLLAIPMALFVGLVFLFPATHFAGRVWTDLTSDVIEGQLVVSASKRGGARGCRIRNEFYVRGSDGNGFWCGSTPLQTGSYPARVKVSGLGTLVLHKVVQE